MKTRSLALLTIIMLIVSCAGGPGVRDEPPEWAENPIADTESDRAFRGEGEADTMTSAKSAAIEKLRQEVLESMNLGDPEYWSEEGLSAVNTLLDELERMIRNPEYADVDGVNIIHKEGWKNPEGSITYVVDITWDKDSFDKQSAALADLTGVTSSGFRDLENRARVAESDGNTYEAALIWAAAAGVAESDGNISGYRTALREVVSVLDVLDFMIVSVPDQAYVGTRPDSPVVFSVSAGGKPVGNAEFVITYPRNARDDSPSTAEARIFSDDEGVVRFLQPLISNAGTQHVTIAPSADPFLEYLDESGDTYSDNMIIALERARMRAEYEALSRIRTIPMGILILETDLAGNTLNSADATRGLFDNLAADGFNIDIMELDPGEMLSRTERALLRDLKADPRFADRYDRVIHGTVTLESFEQNGDSYTVRVSGTLAMSDIRRQVTLYRSEITKTSQASDSQQAMSAAFRQLGRSFAGELIEQVP